MLDLLKLFAPAFLIYQVYFSESPRTEKVTFAVVPFTATTEVGCFVIFKTVFLVAAPAVNGVLGAKKQIDTTHNKASRTDNETRPIFLTKITHPIHNSS